MEKVSLQKRVNGEAPITITKDIFEFRDFSMRQASSGQRINTDSCVFSGIIGDGEQPKRILDIGAGTGVVALMLASRFPAAQIVAVEPEEDIVTVARENLKNSPWSLRLSVVTTRAQDLDPETVGRFDFVVSNPPYFQRSQLPTDRLREVARHTTSLVPVELFSAFTRLMTADGTAWMSCPGASVSEWMETGIQAGLYCHKYYLLYDHPKSKPHVAVLGWSFVEQTTPMPEAIVYRTEEHGVQSPWMAEFRRQWFPSRYYKSN